MQSLCVQNTTPSFLDVMARGTLHVGILGHALYWNSSQIFQIVFMLPRITIHSTVLAGCRKALVGTG